MPQKHPKILHKSLSTTGIYSRTYFTTTTNLLHSTSVVNNAAQLWLHTVTMVMLCLWSSLWPVLNLDFNNQKYAHRLRYKHACLLIFDSMSRSKAQNASFQCRWSLDVWCVFWTLVVLDQPAVSVMTTGRKFSVNWLSVWPVGVGSYKF